MFTIYMDELLNQALVVILDMSTMDHWDMQMI